MAHSTVCQTPGAGYNTHISSDHIEVVVEFPRGFSFTKQEAELLEANIHNAMELVLARYFMP